MDDEAPSELSPTQKLRAAELSAARAEIAFLRACIAELLKKDLTESAYSLVEPAP